MTLSPVGFIFVGFRLCLCVCTCSSMTALRPVNPAYLHEGLFSAYTSTPSSYPTPLLSPRPDQVSLCAHRTVAAELQPKAKTLSQQNNELSVHKSIGLHAALHYYGVSGDALPTRVCYK